MKTYEIYLNNPLIFLEELHQNESSLFLCHGFYRSFFFMVIPCTTRDDYKKMAQIDIRKYGGESLPPLRWGWFSCFYMFLHVFTCFYMFF